MKSIGIFGGSFNPVHNGHIKLCEYCIKNGGFDKIIIIPDNIPPHKQAKEFADGAARMEMLRLAFTNYSDIEISDIELKMGGISYTVYTLKKLKKLYPHTRLYLIIGSDMLFSFKKWYKYKKILRTCRIYVAARETDDYEKLLNYRESFGIYKNRIIVAKNNVLPLSSTIVRNALKEGKGSEFVPEKVYEYILTHSLYDIKEDLQ